MTSPIHISDEMAATSGPRPRVRVRRVRITLAENPDMYLREEMG